MVYRLFKALSLILLLAPQLVLALGLGGITLHSALNEPLEAEIDILSATATDIETLDVSLASYETFARVGIDRPAVLMYLRFRTDKLNDGRFIIRVSSREVIREPFLDFILEMRWRSGRVMREYTLLLDPPDIAREGLAPIVTPEVMAAPTPIQRDTTKRSSQPTTSVSQRPAKPQRATPTAANPPAATTAISYGPVRPGETLWGIAEKMKRQPSVSSQQMIMAIYEENPSAFIDGDINKLRKGVILRLEDPQNLATLNRHKAAQEVAGRIATSRATRQEMAVEAKQRVAPAASTEGLSPEPPAMAIAEQAKLKLVTPEQQSTEKLATGAVAGKGALRDDDIRKELMLALEISEVQQKENRELKLRMSELQKQLDSLQRLISLKDNDLALLQTQMSETVAPTAVANVSPPTQAEPAMGQPDSDATTQQLDSASEALVMPLLKGEANQAEGGDALSSTDGTQLDSASLVSKEIPVAVSPQPAATQPPASDSLTTTPSLLATLLENPLWLGSVAFFIALLLILVVLIIKRRRGGGFQESILSGETSAAGGVSTDGPATSFLSDLAISGLGGGSMDSEEGEAAPLSEADVYLAYGRTKQAEELLLSALEKKPNDLDLVAKLLEVHFSAKDAAKFEALSVRMAPTLQESAHHWKRIHLMGHEICPDHPLFAMEPDSSVVLSESLYDSMEERAQGDFEDNVLDIGIDLDELSAEFESSGSEDMDLDFDLDFSDLDDSSILGGESGESELYADSGFDELLAELDSFDTDTTATAAPTSIVDQPSTIVKKAVEKPQDQVMPHSATKSSKYNVVDEKPVFFEVKDVTQVSSPADTADEKGAVPETDIEFDLESFDIDSLSLDAIDASESSTTPEDLDLDLDLDLGLESPELGKKPQITDDRVIDKDDLEFGLELDGLDDLSDLSGLESMVVEENNLDVALDELDFGLGGESEDLAFDMAAMQATDDIDEPLSATGDDAHELETLLSLDEGDEFLFDLDDFDDEAEEESDGAADTKLDLAKAYIDMGDSESARAMLDEVMATGNDTQKQQAAELLTHI